MVTQEERFLQALKKHGQDCLALALQLAEKKNFRVHNDIVFALGDMIRDCQTIEERSKYASEPPAQSRPTSDEGI